jgi:hypothetical protein
MAAGAAAHMAMMNALKASGVVVRMEPADFMALLDRMEEPLVVVGQGGVFRKHAQYLTTYRGLAFFTKSSQALVLPRRAEIVTVRSISVPDM